MPDRRCLRRSARRLIAILVVIFAIVILPGYAQSDRSGSSVAASPLAQPNPIDKIAPWVIDHTANGQQAEFLVVLADQADLSGAARLATKRAKGRYVYETLYQKAQATQGPVRAWLRAHGIEQRAYYLVNAIWVKAGRDTALALAARSDVARLDGNPQIHVISDRVAPQPLGPAQFDSVEPGISYVHAPQVWAMGYTGQGIVVGGQDTGVQWDHPALKNQYRGWNGVTANHDYNWHDSIITNTHGYNSCGYLSPVPCDDYGHGTHTMGTAVGSDGGANQIGMAPGARWIGCRNMDNSYGSPQTYLECFEFFLAPYPVGGTPAQGNPDLAPDVTNNSWICPDYEGCNPASLLAAVQAQRAAGIMTVASAGNSGPSCSTISDPPSFYDEVYTVGALYTGADTIATFSSRGPITIDGSHRRKPDITAPGSDTWSSWPGNTYLSLSGTSMASPHVAGAVALLWSARPWLKNNVDLTEQILNQSAVHINDATCDSPGVTWPNNIYGYGRLDVAAVMNIAILGGVVRDAATSAPIPQALMRADSVTQTFFATTGLDGSYALSVVSDTYTVTVSAQDYYTASVANIGVSPEVTTTQDFTLTLRPRYDVVLLPSLLTETGKIGTNVDYTLYFTNTGNVTDTYSVSSGDQAWPVVISPLSAMLGAQASALLAITVTIPFTATDGLTDTMKVMVTGTNTTASSDLITVAGGHIIFLPLFMR